MSLNYNILCAIRLFALGFWLSALADEASAQIFPTLGGQRAGISALQFLKIGAGARAVGMGEAFVAIANDVTALYYNPAGIVQLKMNGVHFSHTEWLVDIQHEFGAAVYQLSAHDAVGLALTSLHTDDMEITTETQSRGTGRYFRYGDFAIAATYSRQLTDQFSFGATIKYVEETIDVLKMRGVMIDLGTFYRTGLGTTRFAVAVTNFGNQVSPDGTIETLNGKTITSFQEFSPPTQFKIGFAFEPVEDELNRLTTSVQLNHPNDNSENVAFGVEYAWRKTFFARVGYKVNVDEENFTTGVGVVVPVSFTSVSADYAFANFGRLSSVHRMSITLNF